MPSVFRVLLGGLALVLAHPALSASLDDDSGRGWTMVRLDLELTVAPEDTLVYVEGTATLRLDAESSHGPSLSLRPDLLEALDRCETSGAKLTTPRTSLIDWKRRVMELRFPTPRTRGDEIEVTFAYENRIPDTQMVTTNRVAFASWVMSWYPAPLPAEEGLSVSRVLSCPGTTVFHLPPGWRAVTNGTLVAREEDDLEALERWETSLAVARGYAAGPYEVVRHVAGERVVAVYTLSDAATNAEVEAQTLATALDAMEARFGPYPYPSFYIAEVPMNHGSFGACSDQGFILVKPNFLGVQGGNIPLFAHEAAHGWWGNLVGNSGPGSSICGESLAQYGAVVALEAIGGEEAATEFLRFSRPGYIDNQCARGYFALASEGNDRPLARLNELGGKSWEHTLADSKGHWFWHMLRRRVGDEVFFTTIRGLIEEFSNRQMTLDDARRAFLDAAPAEASLERFLAQWLDRTGAPILEAEWSPGAQPGTIEVTLRQAQKAEPYDLRVELALDLEDGTSRRETVALAAREASFTFESAAPRTVRVDPDHRLLLWDPAYGERPDF